MMCPCCKGSGKLPEPRSSERNRSAERARMAKTLRDAGYSLRQIGRRDGIDVTVEGVGHDDDAAVEDAYRKLHQLSEMASEAADAMAV